MAKNGDEHMRSTIFTTDKEAQYDEKAKKILGQKQVLAHILMHTVEEFRKMNMLQRNELYRKDPQLYEELRK